MTFPELSRAMRGPLYGCCASSPDEARLAKEDFCGEVEEAISDVVSYFGYDSAIDFADNNKDNEE